MNLLERAEGAVNAVGVYIAKFNIARLEAQIRQDYLKREMEIAGYFEKHPDDIDGARKKFGIVPIEDTSNSWYRHEMM